MSQEPQNAKPIRAVFSTTSRYGARGESLKGPSDFLQIEFKCHHNDTSTRAVFLNTSRGPFRIALPLFSQNFAPKSELLELS